MDSVTIRPAQPTDTDAIVDLAGRAWRTAYSEILSEATIETALSEWYARERTSEAIQSDDVGYFVATAADIVGYVSGHCGDEVAALGAIYVDPDHWGEGIGTQLLERFEQYCHSHDAEQIEFDVLADNEVGTSFYRARGYSPVETREDDLFGEPVRETHFRGAVDG